MERHMKSRPEAGTPSDSGATPPRRDPQGTHAAKSRQSSETAIFIAVSIIGIWALGNGMRGLLEPGHLGNLVWFAVVGGAFMILFGQMSRVHDTWPRRGKRKHLGRRRNHRHDES
jgi:hypothetical protein